MAKTALEEQHGGGHYKALGIQPVEYCHANKLGGLEFSVIKYITRHLSKAGAEDVKKALHFCQILLKLEYGIETRVEYDDMRKTAVETPIRRGGPFEPSPPAPPTPRGL